MRPRARARARVRVRVRVRVLTLTLTLTASRSKAAGGADRPLEPWEKELLAKVEAADKPPAVPTK